MVLNISIKTMLGTFRSNISICLFKRVNCSVLKGARSQCLENSFFVVNLKLEEHGTRKTEVNVRERKMMKVFSI